MAITQEDALRLYPELHELVTAREAGWIFRPLYEGKELGGIIAPVSPLSQVVLFMILPLVLL